MGEPTDTVDSNLLEAVERLHRAEYCLGRCVQLLVLQNGDRALAKVLSDIKRRTGRCMDEAWDITDKRGSAHV